MKISLRAADTVRRAVGYAQKAGIQGGIVSKYLLLSLIDDARVHDLLDKACISPVEVRKKVLALRRLSSPYEIAYPFGARPPDAHLAPLDDNVMSLDSEAISAIMTSVVRRRHGNRASVDRCLMQAINEARRRSGDNTVSIFDLLLGMLAVEDGVASRVFAKFGLDLPTIRKLIEETA